MNSGPEFVIIILPKTLFNYNLIGLNYDIK